MAHRTPLGHGLRLTVDDKRRRQRGVKPVAVHIDASVIVISVADRLQQRRSRLGIHRLPYLYHTIVVCEFNIRSPRNSFYKIESFHNDYIFTRLSIPFKTRRFYL